MSEPLLYLNNITVARAENTILHSTSLKVSAGEFVYLIGKVGSGKSSLIKAIYSDVPLTGTEARFAEYDLLHIKR